MNLILVDNRKSPDLCQAFGHILNDNWKCLYLYQVMSIFLYNWKILDLYQIISPIIKDNW
jgi:hypothetical protein